MIDSESVPLAEVLIRSLVGQDCSVVRDSIGEQLVIGFGGPTVARWPLRETLRSPWLMYSRYGSWEVTDGVGTVASDVAPLDSEALQRVRAVMLHQQVSSVEIDGPSARLLLEFWNGAGLKLQRHDDAEPEDEAWSLQAPGLVIEGRPGRVAIAKLAEREGNGPTGTNATAHELLRAAATLTGFRVFEPPASRNPGFDAVLTAPDGTVLLVQVKFGPEHGLAMYTVTVGRDLPSPTAREIPLKGLTVGAIAAQLLDAVTAA